MSGRLWRATRGGRAYGLWVDGGWVSQAHEQLEKVVGMPFTVAALDLSEAGYHLRASDEIWAETWARIQHVRPSK